MCVTPRDGKPLHTAFGEYFRRGYQKSGDIGGEKAPVVTATDQSQPKPKPVLQSVVLGEEQARTRPGDGVYHNPAAGLERALVCELLGRGRGTF